MIVLHQANDERAKAQGVTILQNSHQQGNKGVETGRVQNMPNAGLTRGMTTLDEFKYGFPSKSLSTTSNKWWGSSDHDDGAGTNPDGAQNQTKERGGESAKAACETGNSENCEIPQGSALLRAVRKGAVEKGRQALKLGVFRGYGVNKLSKRDKILLHQIFRSSLPRSWIHDL